MPKVPWKDSNGIMSRFEVVDLVEAGHLAEVEKAAMIIRAYEHAGTGTGAHHALDVTNEGEFSCEVLQ